MKLKGIKNEKNNPDIDIFFYNIIFLNAGELKIYNTYELAKSCKNQNKENCNKLEKIIIDYKTAISKINDKNIDVILQLILEDELNHKDLILKQIEKLK